MGEKKNAQELQCRGKSAQKYLYMILFVAESAYRKIFQEYR